MMLISTLATSLTSPFAAVRAPAVAHVRMTAEAPAPAPATPPPEPVKPKGFGVDDLANLAYSQNPVVGFFDPLGLSTPGGDMQLFESSEATIGWLRHAEMKHGRIAMAGFVGYVVHENGIRWPFALSSTLPDYSSFDGLSAPAVWDAIPLSAKLQIVLAVGWIEVWTEFGGLAEDGRTLEKHYMRGGTPGKVPSWKPVTKGAKGYPLDLFDPFGLTKKYTDEKRAKQLNVEVNNGRLAMIGLYAFLAEATHPGAVPFLYGQIKPYDGNFMAPFASDFSFGALGVNA